MAELTTLEPISTGDVIDRAIRLYRRNFIPLISVVAVPALIYYASAMMVSFGYAQTLQSGEAGFNPAALLITMIGLAGYVVYLFAILSAVCGMCRAIGDHMMLGEPLTFKGCWRFARRRLGDVAITAVISVPLLGMVSVVIAIVFIVLIMGVAFLIGLGGAIGLPAWLGVIGSVLLVLASTLLFAAITLLLAARLIFVPQALMIEGRSATAAIGRAFQLGGGRIWYRLGMIGLFSYFVNLAILAALIQPLMILFWVNGWSATDLLLQPGWNAVYAAVNQISALLVWPIWITSFTILYFDTRVRKEGYDIELMTAELPTPAPAYAGGMPAFQPPVVQWGGSVAAPRQYMQTGPLGLGGYPVRPQVPTELPLEPGVAPAPPDGFGEPAPAPSWNLPRPTQSPNAIVDEASIRPSPTSIIEPGSVLSGTHRPEAGSIVTQGELRELLTELSGTQPAGPSTSTPRGVGTPIGGEPRGVLRCAVCGLPPVQGAKYCIGCGDLLQSGEAGSLQDPERG